MTPDELTSETTKHAAGAGRRIKHLEDLRRGVQLLFVSEQKVHHQSDHLAGREVFARASSFDRSAVTRNSSS